MSALTTKNSRTGRFLIGFLIKKFLPSQIIKQNIYSRLSFTRDVNTDLNGKKLWFHCFNELMSNTIFYTGIFGKWEGQSLKLWFKIINEFKPKEIFDIGAFSGIYSLVAASADKNTNINAFEPNHKSIEILRHNLALNQFLNISVNEFGLLDETKKVEFFNYDSSPNPSMSSLKHEYILNELDSIYLDCVDINEFLSSFNKKVDLIKLDIERAEYEVLNRASKYIERDRPIIFLEILDNDLYERFNSLFKPMHYKFIQIDDQNMNSTMHESMLNAEFFGSNWIFFPEEYEKKLLMILNQI